MNQDASPPSFELPAPLPKDGERESMPSFEQVAPRPEQAPAPPPMQPVQPVPALGAQQPLPQPPAQPAAQDDTQASTTSPAVAEDNDLIEKEWVIKAKQIVAATRENPYAQSRELSKFKADYLKKRYSKDVKLEES